MSHKISADQIDPLIKGPSASKVTQVSDLQNYIQDLLGDTHHTFLQGSYKNDTAISDINDVDVIAIRNQTYSSVYSQHKFNSSVSWNQIFTDIEYMLRNQSRYTNWVVSRGDKCIKITGAINADIIPAVKVEHDHLTDPIVIYSHSTGIEKINYPRVHHGNTEIKHKLTGETYKPTVRMFKNWARNQFNDDKIISSFKIQALVYGIKNENFFGDFPSNFIIIGNKILALLEQVPSQIMSVCGTENILDSWDIASRNSFSVKLRESLSYAFTAYEANTQDLAESNWRMAFNL